MAFWLGTIQYGLKEVKELFSKQEVKYEKAFEAVEAVYKAENETVAFLKEFKDDKEKPNNKLREIWKLPAQKVRDLVRGIGFDYMQNQRIGHIQQLVYKKKLIE